MKRYQLKPNVSILDPRHQWLREGVVCEGEFIADRRDPLRIRLFNPEEPSQWCEIFEVSLQEVE